MTSKITYNGDLRTTATHLKSGTVIETDAPTDNHGKGERFSPTDLVATALGSCMLSIMGIVAGRHALNIEGSECDIEKIMEANPRRIGEIKATVTMRGSSVFTDKDKQLLEHAAMTCPVFQSLSENLKKTVHFSWPA